MRIMYLKSSFLLLSQTSNHASVGLNKPEVDGAFVVADTKLMQNR